MKNSFRYFNSSPEVIRLTVMMYIRYPLSLRQAAIGYALSAGMNELDARKVIAARFADLFGRTATEYLQERQAQKLREAAPEKRDRLFPAELCWDRDKPAFRIRSEMSATRQSLNCPGRERERLDHQSDQSRLTRLFASHHV